MANPLFKYKGKTFFRRRPSAGAGAQRQGFTLLEVLLVVALIGVATGLFVVSVESLGRTTPADELEAAFWRAMSLAREKAVTSRRPVQLQFDKDNSRFVIVGEQGGGEVPVSSASWPKDMEWGVAFTEERPSNDFILVRGQLVTRRPILAVKVFPDGTCQSFGVELTMGKEKHLIVVDPWTGAELLGSDDSRKGPRR